MPRPFRRRLHRCCGISNSRARAAGAPPRPRDRRQPETREKSRVRAGAEADWSFEDWVRQDGGDGLVGIVGSDGNTHVRQAVLLQARVIERPELDGIARQRANRIGCRLSDAPFHDREGTIQPDRDAVAAQQLAILFLRERAASKREYRGTSTLDPSHVLLQDAGFDPPEFLLAPPGEEF